MSILNNTNLLQDLLDTVNALPEAGVDLPELSNEASASDLLLNKQLIDGDGNIVTGTMPNNGAISSTMDGIDVKSITVPAGYTSGGTVSLDNTIDDEVNTQADLLAQAVAALEGKAAGGGGGFDTCTITINETYTTAGMFYYTSVVDGELVSKSVNIKKNKSTEINDVLCGSCLTYRNGYPYTGFTLTGEIVRFDSEPAGALFLFTAPTEKGALASITTYDND